MTIETKPHPEEGWTTNPDDSLPADDIPTEVQQHVSLIIPDEFRIDEDSVAVWSADEHGRTVITFDEEAHAKESMAEFLGDHGVPPAENNGNND